MRKYDFIFVLPEPYILSYPPGGVDIVYRLSNYLASKKYKTGILFVRIDDNTKYKKSIRSILLNYLFRKFTHSIFRYNSILTFVDKIIGSHYDYSILKKVDLIFDNDNNLDASRIFATAWPTAYRVNEYLDKHNTKGFYLIQNFEDNKLFSGNNYNKASKTYKLKRLRKVVVCNGLYKRFKDEKPLQFNVGIDKIFSLYIEPIKRNKYTILLPLRKGSSKGSVYALEAAKILRNKSKDFKFLAFGDVNKKRVPKYIEYYYQPSHKNLVNIYNKASIFVFPSIIEGFGLPPLEAMACGCATVISESIGVDQYAQNNFNCIKIPVRDSIAICKAVELLIKNDDIKYKIINNGIKTANKFSYDLMFKDFGRIFKI